MRRQAPHCHGTSPVYIFFKLPTLRFCFSILSFVLVVLFLHIFIVRIRVLVLGQVEKFCHQKPHSGYRPGLFKITCRFCPALCKSHENLHAHSATCATRVTIRICEVLVDPALGVNFGCGCQDSAFKYRSLAPRALVLCKGSLVFPVLSFTCQPRPDIGPVAVWFFALVLPLYAMSHDYRCDLNAQAAVPSWEWCILKRGQCNNCDMKTESPSCGKDFFVQDGVDGHVTTAVSLLTEARRISSSMARTSIAFQAFEHTWTPRLSLQVYMVKKMLSRYGEPPDTSRTLKRDRLPLHDSMIHPKGFSGPREVGSSVEEVTASFPTETDQAPDSNSHDGTTEDSKITPEILDDRAGKGIWFEGKGFFFSNLPHLRPTSCYIIA